MLRFSDGEKFSTAGPLHLTRRSDGWYVVGQNMLIPVQDVAEGHKIIQEMRALDELKEAQHADR